MEPTRHSAKRFVVYCFMRVIELEKLEIVCMIVFQIRRNGFVADAKHDVERIA